jgi:hypothetical protein
MDRNYIDRHLLVDRYLSGTLPDNELADFEARLVWDEELIDELDLAERLREGMLAAARERQQTAPVKTGVLPRLRLVFSNAGYAAAASFLVGIALSVFVLGYQFQEPVPVEAHYTVNELQVFRGAGGPVITTTPNTTSILRFEADRSYDEYRVTIQAEGSPEPLWQQGGLVPDRDGMLAVGVPGVELPPGSYLLTVYGVSDGQVVLDRQIPFATMQDR